MEFIGELIVNFFGEIFLQIICYYTARLIVPMVTLGYIRVQSQNEEIEQQHRRYKLQGKTVKRVLEAELASLIGLLLWCIVIACVGVYCYFV